MAPNRSILVTGIFAAAGMACLLPSCKDRAHSTSAKPNVILVLTDDQGYGDLSVYGNPILKTPVLDSLHDVSVRFTDFHVSPMCSPTRGQLMTGRDAMDNGCTAVCLGRSMVREDLPYMADIFRASGYQTAHFGKWHMGDSYPYRPEDRGFEENISHGAWGIGSIADYAGNTYWKGKFHHNEGYLDYDEYCTNAWFDYTLNYINGWKKGDKPFFIYLATNCPHGPHLCDDRYSDPYLAAGLDTVTAKFFGQIVNIDENMRRLLKTLDDRKLSDNTILIYLTDNGTVQGDKVFNAGMRGKKTLPYEGGHRVPLFVRWPGGGLGEPRDIDALTECQDILPSLIDWCHLMTPENAVFDGTSLAPLFRGETGNFDDRILVVQYDNPYVPENNRAVMWKKWRLVKGSELYNLSDDPGQENDIAAQNPEVAQKLKEYYDRWLEEALKGYKLTRYIHLGTDHENPCLLYSSDWQGSYADNIGNLLAGNAIGWWDVIVENPGTYEFTLSRWHPASGMILTDSLERKPGVYRGGLPIAKARIRVGDEEQTAVINAGQRDVKFTMDLPEGPTKIETWFLDKDGREICSAYYTAVERR
jgi:arylsulfatase A-like enzyme